MATRILVPNADFSTNAVYQELETQLVNGFVSYSPGYIQVDSTNATTMARRVRTGELNGKYHIKVNSGYLIRGISYYDDTSVIDYSQAPIAAAAVTGGGNAVVAADNATEYTFSIANKKSCITFSKTDANQNISPTENIIAELYYIE